MKLIVAGSRGFTDYNKLCKSLDHLLSKTPKEDITIISGAANGADKLGERFAQERGLKLEKYPAKWKIEYFRSGGFINRDPDMVRLSIDLKIKDNRELLNQIKQACVVWWSND